LRAQRLTRDIGVPRGPKGEKRPADVIGKGGRKFKLRHYRTAKALAFCYFEDEPIRRRSTKRLTRDEARRIAVNIADLPALVTKGVSNGDR
jgi:hypothetical protein